ncbi:MAG: hypothetical protein GY727_00600 [Gammaproteobacteria bacterium]|nr:hypothetical protein [Gammaproteobacteria bacterium]MCP4972827.1 hypothetical protein [Prochlorococcus sp.]
MVFGLIAGAALGGTAADQAATSSVEAAEADIYQKQLGLDEQQRQYDLQNQLLAPFYQAGQASIPQLQRGARGLNISQLLQYAPYQQAAQEAQADTRSALGSRGLRRSQFGLEQVASTGVNELSNIESLLNQRAQSLAGQSQTTGFSLGQRGATTTGNISNLLQAQGGAAMANALRQGNIQGQLSQNLVNLGAATLDYYR